MAEYFLYYAGMSNNNGCEQIGLAISRDGNKFNRVNTSGLIIKIDPEKKWKNLRVCNPTVMCLKNKFILYYQGISTEKLHTSIGIAYSTNGVDWNCQEEPCLSAMTMRENNVDIDYSKSVRLTEPSIIIDNGLFKMWFIVYQNEAHLGNSILYAESEDGQTWSIRNKKLLTGNQFGKCNIHYPQVVKNSQGYTIHFTLINMLNNATGIFKMDSSDGLTWGNLEQLLPLSTHGFSLKYREHFMLTLFSRRSEGISTAWNRKYSLAFKNGENYFGYSHSHLMELEENATLFYHNNNLNSMGKMWMDIGCCKIVNGKATDHQKILEKTRDSSAWDAVFVADPYVISL